MICVAFLGGLVATSVARHMKRSFVGCFQLYWPSRTCSSQAANANASVGALMFSA